MIRVHHLNNSRSQRILWLLEELELPYEIVFHQRDPVTNLAPPALKAIHPLGKSPVIEHDGRVVAESGAIIEYICRRCAGGRLTPAAGGDEEIAYWHWMHFAEGSAMLPLLLALYTGYLGEAGAPLQPRIQAEIMNHLSYMDQALADKPFLVGQALTGADINNLFVVEAASASGAVDMLPHLKRYRDALHARPAYQRVLEKGGRYDIGKPRT
jgi:glutathione S-transferase